MKTPYFLIDEAALQSNLDAFTAALSELWPNSILSYSVKTNSLPWLLKWLLANDVFAEVVSDEEYELAMICGFPADKIVFNGPIKGEALLVDALKEGSFVNLDSRGDLKAIELIQGNGALNIGLRLNLDPSLFDSDDIGYEEYGFRFGFSDEVGDFAKALEGVRKVSGDVNLGLHLHCNSVTRSPNVYRAIGRAAAGLIEKYDLDLSFIDFGGGFFGGVPGKATARDYLCAIMEGLCGTVDPAKTTLILEPGSAIVGSAVSLHTRVLDVKDTVKTRIVTTDGSRIHIDPLWIKRGYLWESTSQGERFLSEQVICGYTCMDHDRLMVVHDAPEFSVGDEIVYKRVGAYSMTFGSMFIRYFPEVYVDKGSSRELVRSRIDVKDYFDIHS